jgi:RNA polymerase sigma-70 factor (ECF subfamily)
MAITPDRLERAELVTDLGWGAIPPVKTEELVARARSGDGEAYGMLFERFHDEIYRFATRRIGDPTAGQDVAADTFADAFGSLPRYSWTGVPFEAWLYTIARRRVADHLRARTRRERVEPALVVERFEDHAHDVVDAMHMRELIARLSETERDVIEMRFMEDLDVEATALRLGKKPGAVRVAQHRALARLRSMMKEAAV